MSTLTPERAREMAAELQQAANEGQSERADALLKELQELQELGEPLPASLRSVAADLRMSQERWSEARALLEQAEAGGAGGTGGRGGQDARLRRTLCRNMEELQRYRPEVYASLTGDQPSAAERGTGSRYELGPAPGSGLGVFRIEEGGRRQALSPTAGSGRTIDQVMQQAGGQLAAGLPFLLGGIADGEIFSWLVRRRPELLFDYELPLFLIEPDTELVWLVLMLRNLAGEGKAIRSSSVFWFVGSSWRDRFLETIREDLMLSLPVVLIGQSPHMPEIRRAHSDAMHARERTVNRFRREAFDYYRGRSAAEFADLFGPEPPRTPRVLLATSRYTTVLQHATRDVERAFGELGWVTELLIEETNFQQMSSNYMLEATARFKPDLVFMIDHLRYEYHCFPPELPHVCWIQDHLPNLAKPEAGQSVGHRDFVLNKNVTLYADRYDYPPEQSISLGKLTRHAVQPGQTLTACNDEITFVSNASAPPEKQLEKLLESLSLEPELPPLVRAYGEHLIRLYDGGGSLSTRHDLIQDLKPFLDERSRTRLPDPRLFELADRIFEQFNNHCYRQQALGWVVEAAEERGLEIALYGYGWEENPRFARYARGYIQYGEPLEEVTRRSRFNLQIVPYLCLHQRLLDGIAAGGLFLIRRHPVDLLLPELRLFTNRHIGRDVTSVEEAMNRVDAAKREEFRQLLDRCACIGINGDVIRRMRDHETGLLLPPEGEEILPHFGEVSFTCPESLRKQMDAFGEDADRRREVIEAQATYVHDRFGYTAGVRRVCGAIHERLRELAAREEESPVGST